MEYRDMSVISEMLSSLGICGAGCHQHDRYAEERQSLEACSTDRVVFMQSEKVCATSARSTLLETAEKNGIQMPYGCRMGICGTCATRVFSGVVEMEIEEALTGARKNSGYVLPCAIRITGTVIVAA